MNIQELSTAVQYRLPVKVFITNNYWMGMVRHVASKLLHGERYSESYSEALPDFVKLAEAFGAVGLRASSVEQVDGRDRRDDLGSTGPWWSTCRGGEGRELLSDDPGRACDTTTCCWVTRTQAEQPGFRRTAMVLV